MPIIFDNSYARLPDRFYERIAPTPVAAPRLVKLNDQLAAELGLDTAFLRSPEGVAMLAGNAVADGSEPIAQAYAGHQFGGFNPQLGDGRANLLGEVVTPDGRRFDIQLKGSGPTRFSRRGDGRAALGPVLREYIVAEAMAALGIPTTRSLAVVATGETVARETLLPGAVLTRIAASHIRIGTFQYFAVRRDVDGIRTLIDHVIARHYPDIAGAPNRGLALLDAVIAAQAKLIARWMCVGFIHGVMNTDNMSIAAETIDYGPCAFMDAYDPAAVYSSIDHGGRYAFANQPRIAQWNLARLAETLLPVIAEDEAAAIEMAQAALTAFGVNFDEAYTAGLRDKLGLATAEDGDAGLAQDLLNRMAANAADFTLTFRHLCEAAVTPDGDSAVRGLFADPSAYDAWAVTWRARLAREDGDALARRARMRLVNPGFIPRNHLVEEAIQAAYLGRFEPLEALVGVLATPYDDRPGAERYTLPPAPDQVVRQTFCGT